MLRNHLFGLAITVVTAQFAVADTLFANREQFEAALGALRVITFDPDQGFATGAIAGFDNGQIVVDSSLGDYQGPASVGLRSDGQSLALTGRDRLGEQSRALVRLLFAQPPTALGFDSFGSPVTTWTLAYTDGSVGEYILEGDENTQGDGTFMALISDRPIASISLLGATRGDPHNPGEQPHYIDNFTLIPEPKTIALLVVPSIALLVAQRRRRRQ